MSIVVQLGLAVILLYVGLKKSSWYIKWPALLCAVLMLLRPLDGLIHWVTQFVPTFLGV